MDSRLKPRPETAPDASPDTHDETRIERLCVERGLKMTGQRRVIARVLSGSEDHPDVEDLYRRAAALDGRISIATVYRTVRLLGGEGHPGAAGFRWWPGALRTDRAWPPLPL